MQVVECNPPRIVGRDVVDWQLHGCTQRGHAGCDYPMANASHNSHYRERNHLGQPRQPALVAIDEECRNEEK